MMQRKRYALEHRPRWGVALVRRYDGEFPDRWASKYLSTCQLQNLNFPKLFRTSEQPEMTSDYFNALTDKFRSPHLWQLTDENEWELRHCVESQK